MRILSIWLAATLTLALSACAGRPPAAVPSGLFHDELFAAPRQPASTDGVFALSDAMRRYLAVDIAPQLHAKGAQTGLLDALYSREQLKLEYDTAATKTAAEAFATRSGNCLSLVIMTAALAKELRLPVTYASAYLDDTWSRQGDLLIASGHVNITLSRRLLDARTQHDLSPMTVDFLPAEEIRRLPRREIDEGTVLAMYANNRAAEAIAAGDIDAGYAWAREALRHDARFTSAWNTLGVAYLRQGAPVAAAPVFEHALSLDAGNVVALANLAESYLRQGRDGDADAARRRLAAIEPYPPFHFFHLGMSAMARSDYAGARRLFEREVARNGSHHELHFWLGVADWRLGDEAAAEKQLALAVAGSTTRRQHDLYAAKLAWLQSRPQP